MENTFFLTKLDELHSRKVEAINSSINELKNENVNDLRYINYSDDQYEFRLNKYVDEKKEDFE